MAKNDAHVIKIKNNNSLMQFSDRDEAGAVGPPTPGSKSRTGDPSRRRRKKKGLNDAKPSKVGTINYFAPFFILIHFW